MEIKNDLSKLNPYLAQQVEKPEKDPALRGARKEAPAETGDRVSISGEALLRTGTLAAAQSVPEVRADKVAAIKAKVDAEEYEIDTRKIAERLLQEENELFGA